MRPLEQFWELLKPEVVRDRVMVDWQGMLQADFEAAHRFLKPTGELSETYPCPSPGHDGCPRRVVQHQDGERVAVCGAAPSQCDSIPLLKSDVAILRFDPGLLVTCLRKLWGLTGPIPPVLNIPGVVPLGGLLISDRTRADAYLVCAGEEGAGTFVGVWSNQTFSRIALLSELVGCNVSHEVVSLKSLGEALANAVPVSKSPNNSPIESRSYEWPANLAWEEIQIKFLDGERVSIKIRGTSWVQSFTDMGMQKRNSGMPTEQWKFLRALSAAQGGMSWRDSGAHRRNQKRKELLCRNLRTIFKIDVDPILWDRKAKEWKSRFSLIPE